MKKYCLGFVCDPFTQKVVLIEKARPAWQAGQFNGIGGKLESGETALESMIRECQEETGLEEISWNVVGQITDDKEYHVSVFLGLGDISKAQTLTDEKVHLISWENVLRQKLVKDVNVIWMNLLKEINPKPTFTH